MPPNPYWNLLFVLEELQTVSNREPDDPYRQALEALSEEQARIADIHVRVKAMTDHGIGVADAWRDRVEKERAISDGWKILADGHRLRAERFERLLREVMYLVTYRETCTKDPKELFDQIEEALKES